MKKKSFLLLPVLAMLLSGCNGTASKGKKDEEHSYEETREMVEEALDEVPVEVSDYDGDLTPLPVKEVDCLETESLVKFKQGDQDQFVYVTKIEDTESPSVSSYTPKNDDVIIRDENDEALECEFMSYDSGVSKYRVPVSKFSEDHFYHCELKNNGLKFLKKDPSIRDLTYYSIDVNDSNRRHTYSYNQDNEWVDFDVNNVQYFDVDALGAYFISNEAMNLEVDAMFRIADPSVAEDNKDTTYGRFVSCAKNPNGSGYIVRYNPCRANDVYSNIDVNDSITVDEGNIKNLQTFGDEESVEQQLAHNFLHNDQTVAAMLGLMNHYHIEPRNFKKSAIDWATHVNVKFDVHFEDSTFTWGAKLTLDLSPEDYLDISIELGYKSTTTYDISADLDIETKFFIPVGVSYKLEVKENATKEVYFKIVLSSQVHPYDKDKIEQGIEDDLTDALKNDTAFKSKFKGDSATGTPNGTSYPLIRFDIMYFFPLDIRFEVDFYWEVQLTFETDVVYTSHTTRTDVSISNKKGCDPSSESKAENDKEVKLYFMGTFHAEVGLRVSFGLGISGFYKFFHAEVFIKAYGAVDALGFLLIDVTWGDHGSAISGTMGGKFEITAGVKWGVDINLLFGGITLDWPVKVWTLVGFASDNSVSKFIQPEDTLEITDKDYGDGKFIDLDTYHYLSLETFEAQSFSTKFVDLAFDASVSTRYGEWLDPNEVKYFSAEVIEGNEWIALDGFKISIIKDIYGTDEFTAKIKVTVNPDLLCLDLPEQSGDNEDQEVAKIITVHFTNNLRQTVYTKEPDSEEKTLVGTCVEGKTITLPVPTAPQYMKFVGWKNLTTEEVINYDPTNPDCAKYTIPHLTEPNEVTFEYIYVDYYYWDVVWVDGFGNIVQIDHVYNDQPIVEIDPAIRDKWMVSNDAMYEYVFVGYDVDINVIPTENMVIHAQYEYRKVGA